MLELGPKYSGLTPRKIASQLFIAQTPAGHFVLWYSPSPTLTIFQGLDCTPSKPSWPPIGTPPHSSTLICNPTIFHSFPLRTLCTNNHHSMEWLVIAIAAALSASFDAKTLPKG